MSSIYKFLTLSWAGGRGPVFVRVAQKPYYALTLKSMTFLEYKIHNNDNEDNRWRFIFFCRSMPTRDRNFLLHSIILNLGQDVRWHAILCIMLITFSLLYILYGPFTTPHPRIKLKSIKFLGDA